MSDKDNIDIKQIFNDLKKLAEKLADKDGDSEFCRKMAIKVTKKVGDIFSGEPISILRVINIMDSAKFYFILDITEKEIKKEGFASFKETNDDLKKLLLRSTNKYFEKYKENITKEFGDDDD